LEATRGERRRRGKKAGDAVGAVDVGDEAADIAKKKKDSKLRLPTSTAATLVEAKKKKRRSSSSPPKRLQTLKREGKKASLSLMVTEGQEGRGKKKESASIMASKEKKKFRVRYRR